MANAVGGIYIASLPPLTHTQIYDVVSALGGLYVQAFRLRMEVDAFTALKLRATVCELNLGNLSDEEMVL
jgi:hypothetical protein